MDRDEILHWLEQNGTRSSREGMSRYGIETSDRVVGVTMGALQKLAKRLGKDHDLAADLWKSACYEARMLACLVDDPQCVTRRQMNAWAGDFDNWAICDTACFQLFDKTPFAYEKARQWPASPREFVRRAGFALMASLALHDKAAPDKNFSDFLPLIEEGAQDERNFVKKGVSWALRSIGRRNQALNAAALAAANSLTQSQQRSSRWVGKDVRRDLTRPKVVSRLKAV